MSRPTTYASKPPTRFGPNLDAMPKYMQPKPKLFKRPDSPFYQLEIRITDPSTQKRIRKIYSTGEIGRTRALRRQAEILKAFVAALYTNQMNQEGYQTLDAYFAEYERENLTLLRGTTQKTYLGYIRRFQAHFSRNCKLRDLNPASCQRWLQTIVREPSRAAAYRTLCAVLQVAVKDGRLERNPMAPCKIRKNRKVQADYLEEKEFARFFELMPEASYRSQTIKNMSYLGFATGMRSGEIGSLKLRDIDWEKGLIFIRDSEDHHTKSGNERVALMSPQAREALLRQQSTRIQHRSETVRESSLVFPNEAGYPYDVSAISSNFREARRAALPDRPRLHFHSLRHSFAQNAANNSVPITQIADALGDGIMVTEQSYAPISRLCTTESSFRSMREYLLSRSELGRFSTQFELKAHVL